MSGDGRIGIPADDFDYCVISIGLGFDGFTHRLANWCDKGLFEITFGDSIKKSFADTGNKTDFFVLGDGRRPVPPKEKADALIARIVTAKKPKRVCFVRAGRTAPGTAAAGYFLVNCWSELLHLCKGNNLI